MNDERPSPIDADCHLHHKRGEPRIDGGDAQRRKVDAGLYDPSTQEPRRKWVGYPISAGHECHNEKTSEDRQTLQAIRVRSSQTR